MGEDLLLLPLILHHDQEPGISSKFQMRFCDPEERSRGRVRGRAKVRDRVRVRVRARTQRNKNSCWHGCG